MGKGRPTPRETAKEKKTGPQKAALARTASKKAAAGSKKAVQPKAKKAAPAKEAAPSPTASGRPSKTTKAESSSSAGPSAAAQTGGSPAKPAAPVVTQKPVSQEGPSAQKTEPAPAANQPRAAQTASAPPAKAGAEQVAEPGDLDGVRLPVAGGKVGIFGGPKDRSVKPDDKLGLPTGRHYQFEQFRTLNPKSYYCAMRWEYRQQHMSAEEGKRWWANKKIAVTNPANSRTVIVRAVDHGPHETTGLAIAISPGAAEAIDVEPGQEVLVAFADEKAQLGPLTE